MATIPEGISASHFDIMFTHWGETLTLNRFNGETSNITGSITDDNYGSDESITGILSKREQKFLFDKDGFIERGDAYLLLKYSEHSSDPPSVKDKITKSDGEKFEIDSVINRRDLYYYCRLFKVNQTDIDKMLEDEGLRKAILNSVGLIIESKAKELVPVDTGILRSSIGFNTDTRNMRLTMFASEHGWYMEKGTRPHTPPYKPIERWAKRHNLPPWAVYMSIKKKGIKAGTPNNPLKTPSGFRPFMETAILQSEKKIVDAVSKEIYKKYKY